MKNLTWQNPEQLFVAQELINKVKSKCCGIKVDTTNVYAEVNARMKTAALQTCKVEIIDNETKYWKQKGIMDFLATI